MQKSFFVGAGLVLLLSMRVNGQDKKVRDEEEMKIFKASTADSTEMLYRSWIGKYPQEQYPADSMRYDVIRSAVAKAYAKEKNRDKAIFYIDQLGMEFWKGNAYGGIAAVFYKNGDFLDAETYYKRGVASAALFIDIKVKDNKAGFAAVGYVPLCRDCANVLYEDKKYQEALSYIQMAAARQSRPKADVGLLYVKILQALGRDQDALVQLETLVKAGQTSAAMESKVKTLYAGARGSDAGFDAYWAGLRANASTELKQRFSQEMVSIPAADFSLSDVNGQQVKLSDLRGKVVVLDFWATWCGPCKRSFPAMQQAAEKFRNDPNVKFLFVHTFERDEHAVSEAKHYVDSMRYDFRVLMDLKDPVTKVNTVSKSYDVNTIPQKFIIDGNGNIRFKMTGFDGETDAAVNEILAMIGLAKGS